MMNSVAARSCFFTRALENKLAVTGRGVSPRQEFATTNMWAQKETASKTPFLLGKMMELGFEQDEVTLGFLISERELRRATKTVAQHSERVDVVSNHKVSIFMLREMTT